MGGQAYSQPMKGVRHESQMLIQQLRMLWTADNHARVSRMIIRSDRCTACVSVCRVRCGLIPIASRHPMRQGGYALFVLPDPSNSPVCVMVWEA